MRNDIVEIEDAHFAVSVNIAQYVCAGLAKVRNGYIKIENIYSIIAVGVALGTAQRTGCAFVAPTCFPGAYLHRIHLIPKSILGDERFGAHRVKHDNVA